MEQKRERRRRRLNIKRPYFRTAEGPEGPERHVAITAEGELSGVRTSAIYSMPPTKRVGERLEITQGMIEVWPKNRRVGYNFMLKIHNILNEGARRTGKEIVHRILPDTDDSDRFFKRLKYRKDPEAPGRFQVFRPGKRRARRLKVNEEEVLKLILGEEYVTANRAARKRSANPA